MMLGRSSYIINLKQSQVSYIDSLFKGIINFNLVDLEERESSMDYFLVSKHQTVEENILFSSKMLYDLLDKEKHIDELFLEYADIRKIVLNLNVERILYLALAFLFSVGAILINQNMIKRQLI